MEGDGRIKEPELIKVNNEKKVTLVNYFQYTDFPEEEYKNCKVSLNEYLKLFFSEKNIHVYAFCLSLCID